MRYNLTVALNAMPMFVWGNRKFDWWILDSRSKDGVGVSIGLHKSVNTRLVNWLP